jgi:phosphate transport system permease protein
MTSNPQGLATSRKAVSRLFSICCLTATLFCIVVLVILLAAIGYRGATYLDWGFLTSLPSRRPAEAGIWPALAGSIWLVALTGIFAVPVGVGAALYLEEYAPPSRLRALVQTNIANLAGVPSIVYGILGLIVFVRTLLFYEGLGLGRTVLAGALTLALVVLPIVILASQEALRAVPSSLRHASFALGATKWQTIWYQVLPAAVPGIMTGVILALSRALGEAAPLVAIGAAAYVPFAPEHALDEFTALPIQVFDWSERPQQDFHDVAAAGIIVLLAVLILMNATAIFIRQRFGRRIQW